MDFIEEDVYKFCDLKVINSIENSYKKIVGIRSNLNLITENNKYVGRVLLLKNIKKMIYLDLIVEFSIDKIKWSSRTVDGEFGFHLVDPYWVKIYSPSPKIRVPVKVWSVKAEQIVTEMRELNYKQFLKNRLLEFYGGFQYKYIAAYENFNYMMKNNQYFHCINSTVKNYKIPQKDLIKILSLIDNEKKKIKAEWNKLINIYFNQNESARLIEMRYGKESRKSSKNNVISFKHKK